MPGDAKKGASVNEPFRSFFLLMHVCVNLHKDKRRSIELRIFEEVIAGTGQSSF